MCGYTVCDNRTLLLTLLFCFIKQNETSVFIEQWRNTQYRRSNHTKEVCNTSRWLDTVISPCVGSASGRILCLQVLLLSLLIGQARRMHTKSFCQCLIVRGPLKHFIPPSSLCANPFFCFHLSDRTKHRRMVKLFILNGNRTLTLYCHMLYVWWLWKGGLTEHCAIL